MSSAKFFGQFLLERGAIAGDQLVAAVKIQDSTNVKLGTRAIDAGLMTATDVDRINVLQRSVDKRFGELAIEQGLLTEDQLKGLLGRQKEERLMLGEALIKLGFMSDADLGRELEAFKRAGQGIPGTVAEIYQEQPDAQVLEVCADVAVKMFLRMLHLPVRPASCHADPAAVAVSEYTIYQAFRGDRAGQINLNVSSDLLRLIAGKLLESEVLSIDGDAIDGAGEFLNVVCGNVCAKLSAVGIKLDLEPPRVRDRRFEPLDFSTIIKGGRCVVTPLLHPDHAVELCVISQPGR